MACDDDRCEDDRDYDKESGKGYKSVWVCPKILMLDGMSKIDFQPEF